MGLGSDQTVARFFPVISTLSSLVMSYLVVRWIGRLANVSMSRLEFISFAAMFLALQGVRRSIEYGQTAPLAISLFVLAMLFAERRPWLAGVFFGIASYKLNLAAAFGLALLALGSFTPVVVGGAVAVGLTWAFASSVGVSLPAMVYDCVMAIAGLHGGPEYQQGETEIRTLLVTLPLSFATVQLLYLLLAGGLLCVLLPLVLRRRPPRPADRAVVVLACLIGLMVPVTQQIYNVVLVLPAVWLLHWDRRLIRSAWLRRILPTALLIPLIVNLPRTIDLSMARAAASLPGEWSHMAAELLKFLDRHGTRFAVYVVLVLLIRQLARPAPVEERA